MSDTWKSLARWKDHSFSTILKTGLVRLPRAVPTNALRITNPLGPQPFILQLPSRQPGRTIPLYVFVPKVLFPDPEVTPPMPTPSVFPCVMDYHGGGFYLGSCLEQAPFCAKLCRELQAIVVSVDYRMAPLDKFPAAIEDADDALLALLDPSAPGYRELRDGIADFLRGQWWEKLGGDFKAQTPMPPKPEIQLDRSRIAFSGASSGGNVALNMALSVPANLGLPEWPCRIPADYATQIPLLLLYPSLDLRQLPSERFRHEHMPPVAEHKRLDIDDHLAATYVSREMAAHPRASPGLVDTRIGLHPQAKILLVLSGIDTLWEQSKIWCDKVNSEGRGKDMKTIRYEDRKHGWTTIPEIALSADEKRTRLEVLDECVSFTRAAWDGEDPVKVVEKMEARGPPPALPPRGSSDQETVEHNQNEALAELIEMGFAPQIAQDALSECNGDFEGALNWLLEEKVEMTDRDDVAP